MLVFVYNADSGFFNTLGDIAHRFISPKTYPCNLCAITYSISGMRHEWEQFLLTLNTPYEFLHRDELKRRYDVEDVRLPAVFKKEGDGLEIWLDARAMNSCRNLDELKQLIANKL
jgi:hypothetical protein